MNKINQIIKDNIYLICLILVIVFLIKLFNIATEIKRVSFALNAYAAMGMEKMDAEFKKTKK